MRSLDAVRFHIVLAGCFLGRLFAAEPVTLRFGDGTVIRFTTPAPILWSGEPLPEPTFGSSGIAKVGGLTLKRTVIQDRGGYRIRLAVTNTRDRAIELRNLIPMQILGQQDLLVANTSITDWTLFRLARHKNDIPGPFRPTRLDDASRDAASDSSESTHNDDPSARMSVTTRYHSDPGFVIIPDHKPASSHLFIGFDGQTQHLNDITIEVNKELTGLVKLNATAEFDGVEVPPGGTRETHDLYIRSGKDSAALLADHVERIRKRYGSRLARWRNVFCTWYFYGPEIVADDLRKDLAEMKKRPVKFDTFLIDYNWSTNFGDWKANPSRFPDGMKAMADEIKASGLLPGIWTCPFLVKPDSEALKKYPDLPLKNRAGEYISFQMADMGKFHIVDPTAPSAEAFLTDICKTLTGWGYRYLKFDFVRSLVLKEDAVFHNRSMNRAQAYRRGLEILRKAAGDDAMIGIWGGLYEANAGLVDINRSGSDVRGHWDPFRDYGYPTRYPVRMRQTFARAFYDEKLWTSDQDALQLRRRDVPWRKAKPHLSMGVFTDEEAFSTVVYRFLGGGVVQVSEKLDELAQDRYDLYKMVIPTYAPVAQHFGAWDDYLPELFVSHFGGHKSLSPWVVVSLCNWNGKSPKTLGFKIADVPLLPKADRYAAFEFKSQKFLGIFKPQDTVQLELDSHTARVIRLTALAGNGAYLIGGDLNMSCGMEIEQVNGKRVTLKPAVQNFAAKFTFLNWKDSEAAVETVEPSPSNRR